MKMNKRQKKKKNNPYVQCKKMKENDVLVLQIDMSDDALFAMDAIGKFTHNVVNHFPDKNILWFPDKISMKTMDKELFRKFLDTAEQLYEMIGE